MAEKSANNGPFSGLFPLSGDKKSLSGVFDYSASGVRFVTAVHEGVKRVVFADERGLYIRDSKPIYIDRTPAIEAQIAADATFVPFPVSYNHAALALLTLARDMDDRLRNSARTANADNTLETGPGRAFALAASGRAQDTAIPVAAPGLPAQDPLPAHEATL